MEINITAGFMEINITAQNVFYRRFYFEEAIELIIGEIKNG